MNMLRNIRPVSRSTFQRSIRPFAGSARTPKWSGSNSSEHITNSTDNLDVHSNAAKSGKQDRTSSGGGSAAANQEDARKSNARAKEDRPEAPPGPVLGMNDERGSVCLTLEASMGRCRRYAHTATERPLGHTRQSVLWAHEGDAQQALGKIMF